MKKNLLIIGLFLLGTLISVNAQEMTQKEKNNYAIGMLLGEKIKEEIQKSGMDLSILEPLKAKFKELIDFEFIKEGFRDNFNGESKLAKEEIMSILAALEKEKDALEKLFKGDQKEENESKEASSINYQATVARTQGNLAWYSIFIQEYAQSEQAARKALELAPELTWVKVNLAHALLFQNRFSEAEKIYKELTQASFSSEENYRKSILNDFDELETANAITEGQKTNVEKIRKMLRE